MHREQLIEKGYSEEQVTELLNLFHESKNQTNNTLQSEITRLKDIETKYNSAKKELDEINLSKMTAQEKIEADLKAAENLKMQSQIIYNTAKAKDILAGYDVDDTLISTLVNGDEQTTIASANKLKELLDTKIESTKIKVKEELSSLDIKPNPSNVPPKDDAMTKEKFDKLSMTEQKKWKNANIDEYHQFYPQN